MSVLVMGSRSSPEIMNLICEAVAQFAVQGTSVKFQVHVDNVRFVGGPEELALVRKAFTDCLQLKRHHAQCGTAERRPHRGPLQRGLLQLRNETSIARRKNAG